MANYYRNENKFFVEIPTPTNGTITVEPGEFVKGTSFARQATLGTLVDKGAGEPAEVTANSALLVFTQDENAGVAVGTSIQTAEVDDLAITEGKIAAGAVTATKIGTGAVTEAKLGAGAVTEGKIGAGAVTEGKIGAGAVTVDKIGANAVTSAKVNLLGAAPASATATGVAGTIIFDATHVYFCVATDTWVRADIATWV